MGNSKLDELCNTTLQPFLDSTTPFEEARYVLFGAPLDLTASHRSGARFAPNAIRQASAYMETYSPKTDLDLEKVSIADIGDLKDLCNVEGSLRNVETLIRMIHDAGKIPGMMGGEHTVTLGALRALRPDLIVDFDAHLDLRDELFGLKLSHATFMRRAFEEMNIRVIFIGGRAFSREEFKFAEADADHFTVYQSHDLRGSNKDRICNYLTDEVGKASSVYVSVDMDVLDPAYAPAVGNPSPDGMTVAMLSDLLETVWGENVVGFDVTEITPYYDSGITAINGAHVILQAIYGLERAHRGRRG